MTETTFSSHDASADKFRLYIENAPDGVFIADPTGRYVDVNPAACRMSGYSRSELLSKSIADIVAPAGAEAGLDHFARLKAEGRSSGEVLFRTKSGEERWWSVDAVKISEDSYLGFVKDVTERREAVAALLVSERNYRNLIENLPSGVFIDKDGRIVYANPSFCEMMGAPDLRSLIGLNAKAGILAPECVPVAESTAPIIMAQGSIDHTIDIKFKRLDGSLMDARAAGVGIEFAGGKAVLVAVTDLTAHNEAKRALAASELNYRQLTEHLPHGVFIHQKGVVVYANPAFARMIGEADPAKLSGLDPVKEFLSPEMAPTIAARLEHIAREGAIDTPAPLKLRRRDGTTVEAESVGAAIEYGGDPAIMVVVTDVSARKTAEEALRASERLHRVMMEVSPVGFAMVCGERIVYANPAYCALLKAQSAEQVIGLTIEDVVAGEFVEQAKARLSESVATGRTLTPREVRLKRFDGREIEVETSGVPVDYRGKPSILIAHTDRSFHAKMERSLRETAFRYSSIIENMQDAFIRADLAGRITDVSPITAKLLGYESASELIGSDVTQMYSCPAERDRVLSIIKTQGAARDELVEIKNKNGERLWASLTAYLVRDGNGNVIGTEGIARDVTARMEAEEERRRHQQRLAVALESTGMGVAEFDIENNLLVWDDKTYELFGMERDGPLAFEPALERIHPDDRDRIVDKVERAFDPSREGLFQDVFRVIDEKGETVRHLEAYGKTSFVEGRPRAYYGTHRDVTEQVLEEERKKSEARERELLTEKFHHSQKMESVGRLAGGVAHDYNNILGVIIGNAEMALSTIPESSPAHENVADILGAARRSAEITRQLLAFARKQTAAPKVLDLNEAVEQTLKMLRRLVGEDIDLYWSPGIHVSRVNIDPSHLDQILANLAVNSRDAIAGVGRITIDTRNSTLSAGEAARIPEAAPGRYAVLSFSDNGCGISEEARKHVFEPFFTTKPVGQGTGLGLATVYGIARQNGGFAEVLSEQGCGATFRVYLPEADAESQASDDEFDESPPPGGNETVLIVEDESAALKLARKMLASIGYRVLTADNPGEALKVADAHEGEIDLLLADVVMPEMSGPKLAEKLCARRQSLRVLFMSGYPADARKAREGAELGEGARFLPKPFGIRELALKVREALDGPAPV